MKMCFSLLFVLLFSWSCQKYSSYEKQIKTMEENKEITKITGGIVITDPLMGARFPADFRSPIIYWWENNTDVKEWFVEFYADNKKTHSELVKQTKWGIPRDVWESLKPNMFNKQLFVKIWGISNKKIISHANVGFFISHKKVENPVFYRSVPLPFPMSPDVPRVSWFLADVSSYESPKKLIGNKASCFNCHAASADGRYLGLEINVARNDDRSLYILGEIKKNMKMTKQFIFSWNKDLKNVSDRAKFGATFSTFSPDGRYVMSSVRSNYFFIDYPQAFENFSYFWPLDGILGYRNTTDPNAEIKILPGADDMNYIHATPEWSSNGKFIIFARAKVRKELVRDYSMQEKNSELINTYRGMDKKFGVKFDLYRIDFNDGKGGKPVPIKGASNNNMSNYFPRVSPDGRWIIFTQSAFGFANRPDSDLYIVPTDGGEAHKLECNGPTLDSYHSWSPNGQWVAYATKRMGPYTDLALSEIDELGHASIPVFVRDWKEDGKAINLPIFLNRRFSDIESIEVETE